MGKGVMPVAKRPAVATTAVANAVALKKSAAAASAHTEAGESSCVLPFKYSVKGVCVESCGNGEIRMDCNIRLAFPKVNSAAASVPTGPELKKVSMSALLQEELVLDEVFRGDEDR